MGTRARTKKATATEEAQVPGIAAFKGFNKDLICNPGGIPFQYAVGETYSMESAVLCDHGFHACTNPLDVFTYYPPTNGNRYAKVTLRDVADRKDGDTKVAAKSITIEEEISQSALILEAVRQMVADTFREAEKTTGEGANAATTGYRANAATTGNYANAATTGEGANAATTGYRANAATTGYRANAATTGEGANAATTGYRANAACGTNAVAVALGNDTKAKGLDGAALVLTYTDNDSRRRVSVAYVGEEGIKADTWYELDASGKFVEAA